jgi:hypothetical protein
MQDIHPSGASQFPSEFRATKARRRDKDLQIPPASQCNPVHQGCETRHSILEHQASKAFVENHKQKEFEMNYRRGYADSNGLGLMALCIVGILVGSILLSKGCTQWTTRHWGGNETVNIPPGYVLVNATWKDSNLWILIREEKTGKMVFQERSVMGVLQGSVTFTETK